MPWTSKPSTMPACPMPTSATRCWKPSRSDEYACRIIESIETGRRTVINANVSNDGLIDNLPEGCCVEVPCLVDKNGVQPTQIGQLPPQLAALMQTNINVQALVVEAALTSKREHIYHAAMLDPHTAADPAESSPSNQPLAEHPLSAATETSKTPQSLSSPV